MLIFSVKLSECSRARFHRKSNTTDPRPKTTVRSSTSTNQYVTNGKYFEESTLLCGLLQFPWRLVDKSDEQDPVFVMVWRHYQVYVNLALTRRQKRRYSVIFDTGTGSSFIRQDVLHEWAWKLMKAHFAPIKIREGSHRPSNTVGVINLAIHIGRTVEMVNFNVFNRLTITLIWSCYYCDKHVQSIKTRHLIVELVDQTSVQILRRPPPGVSGAIPLPKQHEYVPAKVRICNKVKVTKMNVLQPETHNWITAVTDYQGLLPIGPCQRFYERHECLTRSGIYNGNRWAIQHTC